MKKEPALQVSGSASSSTMPLVRRSASTAARTSRPGPAPHLDAEGARELGVADGRGQRAEPELEGDVEDDVAAGVLLEDGGPVAEPASTANSVRTRPVLRSRVRTVVMCCPTSAPYAPTFWIGVAPTDPGMPDRASSPLQPRSTVRATKGSHGSPAATVVTAPEQAATSWLTPVVATATTVPSKPSSPTSRFDPPPSTSTGSPAASSARDDLDEPLGRGDLHEVPRRAPDAQGGAVGERDAVADRQPAEDGGRHAGVRADDDPGGAQHLLARAGDVEGHRDAAASTAVTLPASRPRPHAVVGDRTGRVKRTP